MRVIDGGSTRLLCVSEVADRLGVCRATVYELVSRGQLPHVRVGNAIRIPSEVVAALMHAAGKR